MIHGSYSLPRVLPGDFVTSQYPISHVTFNVEEEMMNNKIITEELIKQTISFHGHWCPGLALGIRAAEWALNEMGKGLDEEIVAVAETDMCSVDALQCLTGCTFGKGNLIHKDYGKNAFTFYRRQDGKVARLVARHFIYADSGPTLGRLHAKKLEQGLSGEEKKTWQETRAAVSKRIMESDLVDLFEIKTPADPVRKIARILAPMQCESCGETVMETHTRHFGGRLLCIPCFEAREKR
jgi:formylmethanofuran dehydrogenase subunit E